MKYQKGFSAVTVILVVVFLAIVAGAGYLVYRQYSSSHSSPKEQAEQAQNQNPNPGTTQTNPSATQTIPSTTQIDNWKTYTNAQYGISFQYPKEWGEVGVDTTSNQFGKMVSFNFPSLMINSSYVVGLSEGSSYDQSKGRNNTFDEVVAMLAQSSPSDFQNRKNIVIDGKSGVEFSGKTANRQNVESVMVPLDSQGNIFYAYNYLFPSTSLNFDNFNKFLTTITFTK